MLGQNPAIDYMLVVFLPKGSNWKSSFIESLNDQGRIQNIQKEGAESPNLFPKWKFHFSGDAAYSIVGVFLMQS